MVELEHNKSSVGQSAYHFVFRPRSNIKVFSHPWVREVCEEALREVTANHNIKVHRMKVMPNHVHMFVGLPTTISISKAFQLIKGGSARLIFKKCTRWKYFFSNRGKKKARLWSRGKFYRSVGNVSADVIDNYISHSNRWDFSYLNQYQSTLDTF